MLTAVICWGLETRYAVDSAARHGPEEFVKESMTYLSVIVDPHRTGRTHSAARIRTR